MPYLLAIVLCLSLNAQAQWKSYIISLKGDTLNRTDLKGLKQGPWVIHVDDLRGERGYEEQGYFLNDKREGPWRRFSLEGDLLARENYRYGFKDGRNIYYNNTGDLLREESWRAIDPKNPFDTVNVYDVNDPSIVLRRQVIKLEATSYKNGIWNYYNPANGTIEKSEEWALDRPKEAKSPKDDLAPIEVNASTAEKNNKKQTSKPKQVLEFEKKNSGRHKIKVRDGYTGN